MSTPAPQFAATFGLAIVIVLGQVANVVGVLPRHGDLFRFISELALPTLPALPCSEWMRVAELSLAMG